MPKEYGPIAQVGLLYSTDEYNKDRYTELQQISTELFSLLSGETTGAIDNFFRKNEDYPTVKVDIRGMLLDKDKRVLLVKEQADNKWSC